MFCLIKKGFIWVITMFNQKLIQCSKKSVKKREGSRSFCGLGFFVNFPKGHYSKWTDNEVKWFNEDLKKEGFTYTMSGSRMRFYCGKHSS